jgi:hypothetical protein
VYEFAYTEAPVSMQGTVMGISFLAAGIGFYVSSAVVAVVAGITTDGDFY